MRRSSVQSIVSPVQNLPSMGPFQRKFVSTSLSSPLQILTGSVSPGYSLHTYNCLLIIS
jgi:hypothetical protein